MQRCYNTAILSVTFCSTIYTPSHSVCFAGHHGTQNRSFYGSAYSKSQVFSPGVASNPGLNEMQICMCLMPRSLLNIQTSQPELKPRRFTTISRLECPTEALLRGTVSTGVLQTADFSNTTDI